MRHRAILTALGWGLGALAALPLAACGDKTALAPFTDSRIPPGLDLRAYPPEGWAWGLIQVPGAPPSRYGVAAPPYRAKGQTLILSGYGESAETWFETVRDLNARGQTVWVLEGVGQGGGGRYVKPRDLGHARPGEAEVRAIELMLRRIVRDGPVTLIASGTAAAAALLLVEGRAPVDRLVLSAPDAPSAAEKPKWLRGVGLETVRAYGGPWRRDAPLGDGDPRRAKAAREWQIANPDLRMGGPSQGWAAEHAMMSRKARTGQLHVRAPTVVIAERDAAAYCRRVAICRPVVIAGAGSRPHLAVDAVRDAWLGAFAGPPDPRDVLARAPVQARVDR